MTARLLSQHNTHTHTWAYVSWCVRKTLWHYVKSIWQRITGINNIRSYVLPAININIHTVYTYLHIYVCERIYGTCALVCWCVGAVALTCVILQMTFSCLSFPFAGHSEVFLTDLMICWPRFFSDRFQCSIRKHIF